MPQHILVRYILFVVRLLVTLETVHSNGLQHAEEVNSVFREFLEIFIDHFQCALKQGLQDGRYVVVHLVLMARGRERDENERGEWERETEQNTMIPTEEIMI